MKKKGRLRKKRIFIFLASLLAVAFFLIFAFLKPGSRPKPLTPPAPAPAQAAKEPEAREYKMSISKGGTLAGILSEHGFSPRDIHELKEQIKPVYDLGRIRAGNELRLWISLEGGWERLEYDIDQDRYLFVRNVSGRARAEIKLFPYETRAAVLWAVIEDSPIAAVNKAGEDDFLALALSDIFGSDIDFYTDIRIGDTLKIVFEKKFLMGKFSGYGNILAAEFINQGKTYRAFRFTYPDTKKSDYFDADGGSLRKELLKSPIKFARISSRFSSSRFHPIRKIYRAHYGVDYAAPVGTAVQATGDGTVIYTGWNGGAGRMVRIRHKNAYETMYLHLSGFAPGIRSGAKVNAKQIIGYVGSSGESTGPHLDYRITYHGKYVNPLGWKFRPADPLRKEHLESFKNKAEGYRWALNAPLFHIRIVPGISPSL